DAFSTAESDGCRVKVLIGTYNETVSPIVDDITNVSYFDVQLEAGKSFQYSLPETQNSLLYIFEGEGEFKGQPVSNDTLITLGEGDNDFSFTAGSLGARLLLISGKPIDEPFVQYGPFVMNSREEIDQAMRDFHNNNFVRDKAWVNRKK
ncbi:MAG: pirin family protein, partial [Gammaproteobacteria bacterium]|nr:pirin family protein [Gammaproteobacteria bacterium]